VTNKWPGSAEHPFWKVVSGDAPLPPGSALLNWKVDEAELGSGRGVCRFDVSTDFVNPIGGIQGGYVAAMLDDSMQAALLTLLAADEVAPTLELKTSFLRPARPGSFTGEGSVVHRGRSVAFLEGRLLDEDGTLVATATATATILSASR
jgi:uncharacterized protein (TIGR00369 family)